VTRTTTKSNLGDGQKLWTVTFTSDPCEPGTASQRAAQVSLLKTLADTPELQLCGLNFFEKMRMSHDGTNWHIVLEAVST
jgi:hypothetical protein